MAIYANVFFVLTVYTCVYVCTFIAYEEQLCHLNVEYILKISIIKCK